MKINKSLILISFLLAFITLGLEIHPLKATSQSIFVGYPPPGDAGIATSPFTATGVYNENKIVSIVSATIVSNGVTIQGNITVFADGRWEIEFNGNISGNCALTVTAERDDGTLEEVIVPFSILGAQIDSGTGTNSEDEANLEINTDSETDINPETDINSEIDIN